MSNLDSKNTETLQDQISQHMLTMLNNYDLYFTTPLLSEAWEHTKNLAIKGKNVRSALYINLAEDESKMELAVAIELYQLALLVHDDIMDDDDYRRGDKSIHAFLRSKIDKHDAQSIAICIGDILLFIANAIVSEHFAHAHIISKKLVETGVGQTIDVSLTHSIPSTELMKKMYVYKTATYTFEIPIILALGETSNRKTISQNLGILYQITDDLLTIEHSVDETGKSQFNDVSHSKPTYIMSKLYEFADESEKEDLLKFYKKNGHSFDEIIFIQKLLEKHDVVEQVREDISDLAAKSRVLIEQEETNTKNHLLAVLEFIINRSK